MSVFPSRLHVIQLFSNELWVPWSSWTRNCCDTFKRCRLKGKVTFWRDKRFILYQWFTLSNATIRFEFFVKERYKNNELILYRCVNSKILFIIRQTHSVWPRTYCVRHKTFWHKTLMRNKDDVLTWKIIDIFLSDVFFFLPFNYWYINIRPYIQLIF